MTPSVILSPDASTDVVFIWSFGVLRVLPSPPGFFGVSHPARSSLVCARPHWSGDDQRRPPLFVHLVICHIDAKTSWQKSRRFIRMVPRIKMSSRTVRAG